MEAFVRSDLGVGVSNGHCHVTLQWTNLSKLYVVLIELFFHDLLKYSQNEDLRFSEGHLLRVCKDYTLNPDATRRRTECHLSWSSLWAASEPEPIALAS
jgi:hypothetical protein